MMIITKVKTQPGRTNIFEFLPVSEKLLRHTSWWRRLLPNFGYLVLMTDFCLISAFLLCGRPLIAVNIQCKDRLIEDDCAAFKSVAKLADAAKMQLVFMGEFYDRDNVQCEYTESINKRRSLLRRRPICTHKRRGPSFDSWLG